MDFKLIFNGDLQGWYDTAKVRHTKIELVIAAIALSSGYRLFMYNGKIYHCFKSGGVVGYVETRAKDGDGRIVSRSRIFICDTNKHQNEEFRLKAFCLDALEVGYHFVLFEGSLYFISVLDGSKGIYTMQSTDKYYNEEILISLCIEDYGSK